MCGPHNGAMDQGHRHDPDGFRLRTGPSTLFISLPLIQATSLPDRIHARCVSDLVEFAKTKSQFARLRAKMDKR
jgi:hypothetical protein